MNAPEDPRSILGVEKNATRDEIKARYRELARRYHPDVNGGDETAAWMFRAVKDAYDELSGAPRADQPTRHGQAAPDTRRASSGATEPSRPEMTGPEIGMFYTAGAAAWPLALYVYHGLPTGTDIFTNDPFSPINIVVVTVGAFISGFGGIGYGQILNGLHGDTQQTTDDTSAPARNHGDAA